jgi:nucleoside 2-deoxyribosyltransferase
MRAFLSYRLEDDISVVTNLLKSKNIEIFDSVTELNIGRSFPTTITNAIKESDFIVLVYASANPNIAFEAGLAVSLGKPIFAIVSPDI